MRYKKSNINVIKRTNIVLFGLIFILSVFTSNVHGEEDGVLLERGTCEMTIVASKHGWDNKVTASAPCTDLVFGYYVKEIDRFGIEGMVNYTVEYSGQQFVVSTPNSTKYYEAVLTVYTVKDLPKKEDPPTEEKPGNEPSPGDEPKTDKPNEEDPKTEKPKTKDTKEDTPNNPLSEQPKDKDKPNTDKPKDKPKTEQNTKTKNGQDSQSSGSSSNAKDLNEKNNEITEEWNAEKENDKQEDDQVGNENIGLGGNSDSLNEVSDSINEEKEEPRYAAFESQVTADTEHKSNNGTIILVAFLTVGLLLTSYFFLVKKRKVNK